MNIKWALPLCLFLCTQTLGAKVNHPYPLEEKAFNLNEISALIQQNRSVIIKRLNQQIASHQLEQQKSERLPELSLNGDGYFKNMIPLGTSVPSDNSLLYHFNIGSEFDLYTGGRHTYAIERRQQEQQMSEEEVRKVEQEVELNAYVLLYDIHRNIEYRNFVRSSIHLREKEYERIDHLYQNGLVLKSDLLRSKLYITDLQKDEVAITNSIDILSDQLRVLLGMDQQFVVKPNLKKDLTYHVQETFEELYQYALQHSPLLKIHHLQKTTEETKLKEIRSELRPQVKLYAQYGVGSPLQPKTYDHQLGGEIGAKVSFSLSSFYKTKHEQSAQKKRIMQEQWEMNEEEEQLRNRIFELYTRYHESLLNTERALQKIKMSEESHRILTNSYYNQQALLIDVLESETQSMEASFEWVEAVVDSQKYYWALKQICGYL